MTDAKPTLTPGVEPRKTSPIPLKELDDNGAFVLLVKPLYHGEGDGLAPCSIVLALFRSEYVTWKYNEEFRGCNWGHYFPATTEGMLDALIDFLARD